MKNVTSEMIRAVTPDKYGRRKLADGSHVRIGERGLIGANVEIRDRVTIGNFVLLIGNLIPRDRASVARG